MRYASLMYLLALHPDGDPSGGGAAVADAPPEVAAPEVTPAQPTAAPEPTPVQKALAAAKEAAAKGEIKFEPNSDTPPAEGTAKPGDTPAPTQEAATADKAAGDAPAAGTEGAGAGDDDPLLTIELPVRNEGETPIAIKVTDKETAEALRHLKNSAMKGAEVRRAKAEVEQQQEELAYFQNLAEVDPIGLVLEHMDPRNHSALARHLLASPGVKEAVVEYLQRWDGNPDAERADLAEMDRDRTKQSVQIKDSLAVQRNAREVGRYTGGMVEKLAALVPADLRPAFTDDALTELQAHYKAQKLRGKLAAEQFPAVLERRLRIYGVDKAKALAVLTDQPASPPASERARPSGPDAEALAATAKGKTADGQKLVQAAKVRQEVVAAVPGAGAGVSTPRIVPPKGLDVKGALAWGRKHLLPSTPQ